MVFGLIRRKTPPRAASFYEDLMRAARQPVFYAELGVADTVEGRLEMLMLHVGLAIHRLSGEPAGQELARDLSELFIADMERSLREIGYDDSGLKRRLKKVAGALYGRMEAMAAALASGQPEALAETLIRNVYGGKAEPLKAARLADHVSHVARRLAEVTVAQMIAGPLPSLMLSPASVGDLAISDLEP